MVILALFEQPFVLRNGGEINVAETFSRLSGAGIKAEIISFSFQNDFKQALSYLKLLKIPYDLSGDNLTYFINRLKVNIFYAENYREALKKGHEVLKLSEAALFYTFFISSFITELVTAFPRIPVVYFINSALFPKPADSDNFLKRYIMRQKNFFVVSEFMKKNFETAWGIRPYVFSEFIDTDRYFSGERQPEYITLINPHPLKGRVIFLRLAQAFPDKKFLLAGGWTSYREVFEKNKHKFPNLTYMEPTSDMRKIYSKTKVLLVPSLVEEAFGRVIIEAFINRIPVVANKTGGIPEAAGEAAMLIRTDIHNPEANINDWLDSIKKLDNPQIYTQYSEKAFLQAQSYIKRAKDSFYLLADYLKSFHAGK